MKGAYKASLRIWPACHWSIIVSLIIQVCTIVLPSAFAQTGSMQQPAVERNYQPRPYQGKLESDDGQWIRPAKEYASTRYSSLDQINTQNAKDLKLAFTFSTGMTRGHEAAPLVVNNTIDDQTVAVDATTGKEVWKTRVGDINKGESLTMAPLVVKGKVLVGNSGGEFGIRGWLTALDAKAGKIAWKAYTAGPDRDVL